MNKIEEALEYIERLKWLDYALPPEIEECHETIIQALKFLRSIAEQNVLRVRGSYDAPGFDACVDSEVEAPCQRMKNGEKEYIKKSAVEAQLEAAEVVAEALGIVRGIICEGANFGFNPTYGDWATRLFESQQDTKKALTAYDSAIKQGEKDA